MEAFAPVPGSTMDEEEDLEIDDDALEDDDAELPTSHVLTLVPSTQQQDVELRKHERQAETGLAKAADDDDDLEIDSDALIETDDEMTPGKISGDASGLSEGLRASDGQGPWSLSKPRKPRSREPNGDLYPFQSVINEFEEYLKSNKEQPLATKTRKMYRWMTGSVFRRIHDQHPDMTDEQFKDYVRQNADHLLDTVVEWEGQGFRHFLAFMGLLKIGPSSRRRSDITPTIEPATIKLLFPLPPKRAMMLQQQKVPSPVAPSMGGGRDIVYVVEDFRAHLKDEKGLQKGVENSVKAIEDMLIEVLGTERLGRKGALEVANLIEGNKDRFETLLAERAMKGPLAMAWKRFNLYMSHRGHTLSIPCNGPVRKRPVPKPSPPRLNAAMEGRASPYADALQIGDMTTAFAEATGVRVDNTAAVIPGATGAGRSEDVSPAHKKPRVDEMIRDQQQHSPQAQTPQQLHTQVRMLEMDNERLKGALHDKDHDTRRLEGMIECLRVRVMDAEKRGDGLQAELNDLRAEVVKLKHHHQSGVPGLPHRPFASSDLPVALSTPTLPSSIPRHAPSPRHHDYHPHTITTTCSSSSSPRTPSSAYAYHHMPASLSLPPHTSIAAALGGVMSAGSGGGSMRYDTTRGGAGSGGGGAVDGMTYHTHGHSRMGTDNRMSGGVDSNRVDFGSLGIDLRNPTLPPPAFPTSQTSSSSSSASTLQCPSSRPPSTPFSLAPQVQPPPSSSSSAAAPPRSVSPGTNDGLKRLFMTPHMAAVLGTGC